MATVDLIRWKCQEKGCSSEVCGVGPVSNLHALGWHVCTVVDAPVPEPLPFCPLHRLDGKDPEKEAQNICSKLFAADLVGGFAASLLKVAQVVKLCPRCSQYECRCDKEQN